MKEGSKVRVSILDKLLGVGCTPSTNIQSSSVRHHSTFGDARLPFSFPSFKIATVLLNPGHHIYLLIFYIQLNLFLLMYLLFPAESLSDELHNMHF